MIRAENREEEMNNLKMMGLMVTLTLMLVLIGAPLGGRSGMTFA
jgi:hypothetical protein